TWTVDVDVDVAIRVVGLEMDHLCARQVGDGVVDRRADEDDVLLEEPGVKVVRALTAVGLLHDGGDEVVVDGIHSGSCSAVCCSAISSPDAVAPVESLFSSSCSAGSSCSSSSVGSSRVSASRSMGWPCSSTSSTCSTSQSSAL